jgi:molybdate transport system ATP-binding protein
MTPILFQFQHATIERPGSGPVLKHLDWTVQRGESWAMVGPNGSGKTTLAETLTGRHRLSEGTLHWPAPVRLKFVPFREHSRLFSPTDYYYQQRFEFSEPDDCPTVAGFLRVNSSASEAEIDRTAMQFRISSLLSLKLLKLSNGQMRRTRLARALLTNPELLILDDPFSGLDYLGRAELDECLQDLNRQGTQLILILSGEVPGWIDQTLELRRQREVGFAVDARVDDMALSIPVQIGEEAVSLTDVSVRHGGNSILDRVTWSVRVGERWAVLGPNGSGKSTMLSLICGDHPAAFGNEVRLFGQRRGHGETLHEIKQKVGMVSPELHQYFAVPHSTRQVIGTGFHDTLTPQPLLPEQRERVDQLLIEFGLQEQARTPFTRLSMGTQRLALFLRAIVKRPALLILDEPFQAMDASTIQLIHRWLDARLHPLQTLIMVTHHPAELPGCIERHLHIEQGRIVQRD